MNKQSAVSRQPSALEKYFEDPVMQQSKYSHDFCDSCGGVGDNDETGHYDECSWLLAKKEAARLQAIESAARKAKRVLSALKDGRADKLDARLAYKALAAALKES